MTLKGTDDDEGSNLQGFPGEPMSEQISPFDPFFEKIREIVREGDLKGLKWHRAIIRLPGRPLKRLFEKPECN